LMDRPGAIPTKVPLRATKPGTISSIALNAGTAAPISL
jgi:hypothetical protein